MSLIEQPQDHKDFIFRNLRLGDLMNLSLVCKSLHQDEIRRKWTIQRVVDEYFYSYRFSSGPILHSKTDLFYKNVCPMKKFIDMRLQRLSEVSIRDICKTSTGIIYYNNGLIEDDNEDGSQHRKFDIPDWAFIEIEETTKTKILQNLIQYLYDMFLYAETHGQTISQNNSFELYYLYHSVLDFFKFTFCEDQSMREFVWKLLCDFACKILNGEISNESLHSLTNLYASDVFDLSTFVETCHDTEFTSLDKILEIGLFLKSKNLKLYLGVYLEIRFETLVDLGKDSDLVSYDYCIKEFIQDCNKEYSQNKTKKEYLFDLFRYAECDIMYEFDSALDYRLRRYKGEVEDTDEDPYYDSD